MQPHQVIDLREMQFLGVVINTPLDLSHQDRWKQKASRHKLLPAVTVKQVLLDHHRINGLLPLMKQRHEIPIVIRQQLDRLITVFG